MITTTGRVTFCDSSPARAGVIGACARRSAAALAGAATAAADWLATRADTAAAMTIERDLRSCMLASFAQVQKKGTRQPICKAVDRGLATYPPGTVSGGERWACDGW